MPDKIIGQNIIVLPDKIQAVPDTANSFASLYNQLNTEQKLAVDTIEGPVMVLAGAGTGKTQVLTLRIANILQKTQMNPRNILALTFTDNAAQNMRKRLVKIIGPAAYGVGIFTFHGFANSIIAEFPYKFQFAKELQQIDEIEQIQIMENLLDTLDLQELRPPRAPYHYIREIMGRIGDLKKENIDADKLKELSTSEIERLNTAEDSFHVKGAHKGKMKAAVTEELKHLHRCLELAAIYQAYQNKLTEKGRYDYDDMILFVVRQLEDDADLKAYYQERFQYVLVDEYQDTNNSQNRLIELLGDFFESPNIFVVGDDKQSIFRFQGASMANMLAFYRRYPEIKIISLKNNYRSNQTILDGSHQIISHSTDRITAHIDSITDELVAAKTQVVDGGIPMSLGVFKSPDLERYWVVSKIEKLLQQGTPGAEIAIIYKENREAEAYADLMARMNVPYVLERGSNVLADTDTRRLITMLIAVAEPTNSQALFETLHFDFIGIKAVDLLKLMSYRAKNHLSIVDTLDALPCSCNNHNGNTAETAERLSFMSCSVISELYEKLANWRQASANVSVPELLELVLRQSGLLQQITDSATRVERLHRLRRIFEEAKKIALREPNVTIEQFLRHIELLNSHGIQLVPESLDLGQADGAVRLMTAHKSKGLEFDHVFLPNLVDKHWGNNSRRQLIKLPGGIVAKPVSSDDEKNEDDRRLFYVALTRAKHCLYLTYPAAKDTKELLPSQYLAEISPELLTPIETDSQAVEAEAHLLALYAPIVDSSFTDQEAEYLRQLIREQPLTPTGLNNYLRCPKGYLYKNILRVPTAKTAQQGYGTAIHAALQSFFMKHKAAGHIPPVEELIASFKVALSQEVLSTTEYTDFLRVGTTVLHAYYDKHLGTVTPTVAVEYTFANHHVVLRDEDEEIFLTGILDKLELVDPAANAVRVIDYKTGRARSRNEIEGKTAKADQDYKRQLVFYQLLSELDRQFPYKVVETGLAFVDDDGRFPIEKFEITGEEVEELKHLIKEVRKQMLSLEFPHVEDPNRPPCEFCNI